MTLMPAIVVAAHPDDEVLGASGILTSHRCTIIDATDGVPPDASDPALAETRIAEARVAHACLGAHVEATARLGFADQGLAAVVVDLARALGDVVLEHPGDVYVPAYQRGHPDHDAVFVAAQLARAALGTRDHTQDGGPRAWHVYTLYGLDHAGHERFDWLDPAVFDEVRPAFEAPAELATKSAALRVFASQLPDESVLSGWIDHPVAETYARLPVLTGRLPELRCFYEEVFEFSQFGIDPDRVTARLEAALAQHQPR